MLFWSRLHTPHFTVSVRSHGGRTIAWSVATLASSVVPGLLMARRASEEVVIGVVIGVVGGNDIMFYRSRRNNGHLTKHTVDPASRRRRIRPCESGA